MPEMHVIKKKLDKISEFLKPCLNEMLIHVAGQCLLLLPSGFHGNIFFIYLHFELSRSVLHSFLWAITTRMEPNLQALLTILSYLFHVTFF